MRRRLKVRVGWITLACLLALQACASSEYKKTVSSSGDALLALGNTFQATVQTFQALCPKGIIPAATCGEFEKYANAFKPSYAAAGTAWKAAATANDAKAAASAVLKLSSDLAVYALQAAQAAGLKAGGGN